MIRHVVLFKFKAETEEIKQEKLQEFKSELEALPAIIKEVKLLQIGINKNANELYDLSLVSEFETMEDLHTYATHPEHVKVSIKMRQIMDGRTCVDSEF